ncbi:MAG: DUF262 domain-containing protein [Nitrospinales bacterium]
MGEINSEKVILRKIFSEYWFAVPEYQRSYVWDEDRVNELLEDLLFAFENNSESEYFLGSLVLREFEDDSAGVKHRAFDVLDGQQRLTTLLLLFAVIRDVSDEKKIKNNLSKIYFSGGK